MITAALLNQESGLRIGQKKMESSRRYLLQAEIEFWHEMLRLNRNIVSDEAVVDMRFCLKKAVRDLNTQHYRDQRIAA